MDALPELIEKLSTYDLILPTTYLLMSNFDLSKNVTSISNQAENVATIHPNFLQFSSVTWKPER